ncbi:hypothetical protein C2W62_38130 [Candidatus Entotheonella serta]|nr:hypothetical protein C2W62_38130 [Candidatus Entotheonella serta]
MIPEFTEQGFLPPGIHQTTRDEFKERFALFQRSDRRLRLFEQLDQLLDQAVQAGIVKQIFIAGSFVTAKAEPNDFDCIIVLDPSIVGRSLRPFEYNLVSRKMARRLFGGDVMPALDDSPTLQQYLEFFQTARDGQVIGIVEIQL